MKFEKGNGFSSFKFDLNKLKQDKKIILIQEMRKFMKEYLLITHNNQLFIKNFHITELFDKLNVIELLTAFTVENIEVKASQSFPLHKQTLIKSIQITRKKLEKLNGGIDKKKSKLAGLNKETSDKEIFVRKLKQITSCIQIFK
jgi:hypothetical protein